MRSKVKDSLGFLQIEVARLLGDDQRVFVQYPNLPKVLKPGDRILIDDGLIEMTVNTITNDLVDCTVVNDGKLGSTKVG